MSKTKTGIADNSVQASVLLLNKLTFDDLWKCQIKRSLASWKAEYTGTVVQPFLNCFQDLLDRSKCKAIEGHPSLLFAHKTDIRKLSLDRPSMTSIVNTTRSSCAVDFEFKTGMVFWSDVMEEKIYK